MNLFQATRDQLNWLISLGRKVRKLTPREAAGGIGVFLISQLFLVLSLFLPLKAILLLATEGVPWYLGGLVTIDTKDLMVIGIAIAAIISYGLHHLFGWLVGRMIGRGSRRILDNSKKLHLFDNQADFARDGYLRLIRAIASGLLVGLAFTLGLYLNPLLFALLAGLLVVEFITLHYLLKSKTHLGQALDEVFSTKTNVPCNILSASNFLIGFGLLLAQFLAVEQRNVIVAIISILLIRQIMQRINIGIQDLVFLARNRLRLNALFYTSIQYTPTTDKRQDAFLATLTIPERNRWLASALAQVLEQPVGGVESTWIDSGMPGIVHLETVVSLADGGNPAGSKSTQRSLFIKCYNKTRARLAAHEIQLFTAMPDGLCGSPSYRGSVFIGENRILVFDSLPERQPTRRQWNPLILKAPFQLWSVPPDSELVRAYLRTHPTITSRLKPEMFAYMRLAAETETDRQQLNRFMAAWPVLSETVEGLPLVIKNPNLTFQSCRVDATGAPVFFVWHNWTIEPMGCEASLANKNPAELEKALSEWAETAVSRPKPTVDNLVLVARLFQLEVALKQNRLRQALEISGAIV